MVGQKAVSETSNEIVAIDAMGTQTQVARTILDGGDHVLALKQNRPAATPADQHFPAWP